ncbi:hypothetical protein C8R45DRAFT_1214763, partial [Mycena sanguinolenta]
MLVARRIKYWVEPYLYRVVFLRDRHDSRWQDNVTSYLGLPTFFPDALEQRTERWFHHTRHLFIGGTLEGEIKPETWLLACPNITNLHAQFLCTSERLSCLSGFTGIQYLTIDVRALSDTTVPFPLFSAVTHLELLDMSTSTVGRVCQNIALIPCLTHIALNRTLDSTLSHAMLCANAQLQCIVFLSTQTSLHDSPLLDDWRFVCIDENVRYYVDWLRGAISGDDYWVLADNFLA